MKVIIEFGMDWPTLNWQRTKCMWHHTMRCHWLYIKSLPRRDRIPIYQMAYTKSLVVYSQSGLLSQIFSGIIDQCVGLFIMKLLTFCGIHACEIILSCQPIEDIFTCIRHFPHVILQTNSTDHVTDTLAFAANPGNHPACLAAFSEVPAEIN